MVSTTLLLIANKITFMKLLAWWGMGIKTLILLLAPALAHIILDGPLPNHERPERKFICRQSTDASHRLLK